MILHAEGSGGSSNCKYSIIYNKIGDIIKLLKLLETKQSPKVGFFDSAGRLMDVADASGWEQACDKCYGFVVSS